MNIKTFKVGNEMYVRQHYNKEIVMKKRYSNDENIVEMVDRAAQILEILYENDEAIGVTEISNKLGLSKSTIFRILYTLRQRELIDKDERSEKYKLGFNFIKYGEKVKSEMDLQRVSSIYMESLANKFGESVNLGIRHESSVVIIKTVEGEKSVLTSKLIPVCPLHCSSLGKLFLSQYSEEDLIQYFNSQWLPELTVNTITDYEKFEFEREKILEENVAYDREEYEYGLTCIASPIIKENGEFIAAISISGPTARLEVKGMEKIISELKSIAKEISIRVNI